MIDLRHGDMRDVLPTLEAESVHSVVTDPPYHLSEVPHVKRNGFGGARDDERRAARAGFMGKQWDGGSIAFDPDTWRAVHRVLKPGGYLLAFASTRGYHRMVCAIEDAGFLIHPLIAWVFATGFPKATKFQCPGVEGWRYGMQSLKPAIEPICMAQRPMIGTGTENWLRHGTGGINVDACRVGDGNDRVAGGLARVASMFQLGAQEKRPDGGRWPANLCHDGSPEVEAAFAAFGTSTSTGGQASLGAFRNGKIFGAGKDVTEKRDPGLGDTGTASRFFYTAKADKGDRADSRHPTIKPVDLIRWLVRLVTPPGGTVLDPFAGSGTTGEAAMLEGFDAILIEREAEHAADIAHRQRRWHGGDLPLFAEAAD